MHKLDRHPTGPASLKRYRHGRDQWTITTPDGPEREEIWSFLDAMQGGRCAYCEMLISPDLGKRHIEHFRQRSRHRAGTFDWKNLFGSCNRHGTCGDHKDKCGIYPHEHLIKPDEEDPETYLVFSPDGSIRPRAHLTGTALHRAKETIRILNLDGPTRQLRETELMGYVQILKDFSELATDLPEDLWLPELEKQILAAAALPYATAIRHVLTRQD